MNSNWTVAKHIQIFYYRDMLFTIISKKFSPCNNQVHVELFKVSVHPKFGFSINKCGCKLTERNLQLLQT